MQDFQVYEIGLGAVCVLSAAWFGVRLSRTSRSQVDSYPLFRRLFRFDHGNRFDRFAMWAGLVLLAVGGVLFIIAGLAGVDLNR